MEKRTVRKSHIFVKIKNGSCHLPFCERKGLLNISLAQKNLKQRHVICKTSIKFSNVWYKYKAKFSIH